MNAALKAGTSEQSTSVETNPLLRRFIRLHLGHVQAAEREAVVDRVLANAIQRQAAANEAANQVAA